MKPLLMAAYALLCIAVTSCIVQPSDSDLFGNEAPDTTCSQCDTPLDCTAQIDVCLMCICRDGACAIYDLRSMPRPTDEDSGLPIGRGCVRQE